MYSRHIIVTVLAATVALTVGVAARQAQRGAGRGAAPARGPITPHAYPLDDDHYLRWPLPPGEQRYGRIDGARVKQYVNEITAVSRKSRDDGNQYWGRISGTKYDEMTEAWVEGKFKELGLQNVRRQYFDLPPQWFATKWQLTASGGGKTLTLVPAPSVINHSANYLGAVKRAEDKGAAAVVVILGIPGNLSSQLNTAAEKIPAFSVGLQDGTTLRDLIEHGGARVKMSLAVETRSGLRDASVWGELPGTSDEDVIVMAHHDAYFEGALDNASGMATMVGLAEYFSKVPQAERRRTLKFVTTSGHHNGSLGVKWMHDNRDTFLAKTALLLNCEHVSVTQTYYWGPNLRKSDTMDARRWWVYGSDRLADLALNAYRTFGVAVYHEMEPNASGDMGQASLDAPSVQMIESPAFYHTDQDTPAVVPAAGLEAVGRAYAKLIDQVNKLDRGQLIGKPAATSSSPGR
jgi:Peptidase family M28